MIVPLFALSIPPCPKDRGISPRELRTFLGEPKQRQWKALLERAGIKLRWGKRDGKVRYRAQLTRAQVLRVMRVRYSELGELRLKRWGMR